MFTSRIMPYGDGAVNPQFYAVSVRMALPSFRCGVYTTAFDIGMSKSM